jgi:hypothetical protein
MIALYNYFFGPGPNRAIRVVAGVILSLIVVGILNQLTGGILFMPVLGLASGLMLCGTVIAAIACFLCALIGFCLPLALIGWAVWYFIIRPLPGQATEATEATEAPAPATAAEAEYHI